VGGRYKKASGDNLQALSNLHSHAVIRNEHFALVTFPISNRTLNRMTKGTNFNCITCRQSKALRYLALDY
jgi:hypothetical protein